MEFGAVAGVDIGQLEANNLFLVGNTQADLILPGEVFQGANQLMQIG